MPKLYHIVLGDLFKEIHLTGSKTARKVIPHIVNDSNKFGKGFAESVKKNIPVAENLYRWAANNDKSGHFKYTTEWEAVGTPHEFKLGKNISTELKYEETKLCIMHMIAQHSIFDELTNPKPIKYEALIGCMSLIRDRMNKAKTLGVEVEIHAPRFGSGNAGGTWEFIEDIINEVWVEAEIPVYIYAPIYPNKPSLDN